MFKAYPAVLRKEGDQFWIEFPDLPGCQSCGDSIEDTLEAAQEVLGMYLATLLEDNKALPQPTDAEKISASDGMVTYVTADVDKFRRDTRAVKKMLSIPAWLAKEAEKENISLSKVLQEALKEKLRVS